MASNCVVRAAGVSLFGDNGLGGPLKKPLSTGGVFVHAPCPLKASDYFTLPPSLAAFRAFFGADAPPWEWVKQIAPALAAHPFGATAPRVPAGVHIEGDVFLGEGVSLPAHATIIGPVWIGAGAQIRPGAFIRGNVIAGQGCVLGHSSEFKNCLLLDGVQAPHFNYVGDSVLGNKAHLGAGAICSNLRLDQQNVFVPMPSGSVDTGLKKFGAILGDNAEVGCNAVLNPGTFLGPRSLVMPAMAFGGILPAETIARVRQQVTLVPRKF
jgi:UDP-N-acetylglucosamine diphosphorylase / glucose-1-phosphate thymidylyltransferase / UDP-N-acetylgalactosamine diphosphorylase / glucosamine-1-phosphate N-acetyltransferase / galactosamine-1-phosphate N-acetyltransferase